ncbi:hypothetical protein INR49_016915 [Caranx melampygus]|nr:hypothetical protein INR49_016915 [Caranx melampygus]
MVLLWVMSSRLITGAMTRAEPRTETNLDVVITTVGFLLYLKCDEAQLDAIALFSHQQPLTVGVTRVVVVTKLGVRVEVLLASFCLQTTPTL